MRIETFGGGGRAGFSMIGLLLVLVILLLLSGYYFSGGDGSTNYLKRSEEAVSTYPMVKNRANETLGNANLQQFETQITQWEIAHPGEKCTIEILRAAGYTIPQAPQGQRWEIDEDNNPVLVQDAGALAPGSIPIPNVP